MRQQFRAVLRHFPIATTLVVAAITSGGCSSDSTKTTPTEWADESPNTAVSPLSYEQFRDRSRVFVDGKPDGFIIEQHIRVFSEESLRIYYHAVYEEPVDKSVGWTINGALGKRPTPSNISYCFANGWSASVGGGFTAPSKASIVDAVAAGARHWQGVANVVFKYRSDLDGAGCTTANIANGSLPVSFVVKPVAVNCTASGAFPWMVASDQALNIPSCGLPGYLADHELGHILGLRHEMEHSQNDCGYGVDVKDTDLTAYDRQSVMFYSNCTGDASSRVISSLDGVGIRKLYGPPSWWWSMIADG